jgi:hypothetical protein
MNEAIKKVLFGNQKQSLRQNEAIVNFVDEYLKSFGYNSIDDTTTARHAIANTLSNLEGGFRHGEVARLEDKLFLEYILGVDGYEAVLSGVECRLGWKPAGDSGKIIFYVAPDDMNGEHDSSPLMSRLTLAEEKICSREGDKARSAEDEAWELVNKMNSMMPPSVRAELPQDDALAAILFSQQYWKYNS